MVVKGMPEPKAQWLPIYGASPAKARAFLSPFVKLMAKMMVWPYFCRFFFFFFLTDSFERLKEKWSTFDIELENVSA